MAQAVRSLSRLAAMTAVLLLATSCEDAGPSNVPPLRPGRYVLTAIGYDFVATGDLMPCDRVGVPPEGKNVNAQLVIAQEGEELVGRSPSPQAGTLELRFRVAAGSGSGTPVIGTIRGTAIDAGLGGLVSPKPVQMSFSGPSNGAATFDGSIETVRFGLGRIHGSMRFSNTSGAFSDCPMVTWTLNEDTR